MPKATDNYSIQVFSSLEKLDQAICKLAKKKNASCNTKAIRNRILSDGTKQKFGEVLLQHEIRVLVTRGVNGLFIYAYDEELRNALLSAVQ